MDIAIQTGTTKGVPGVTLLSESFQGSDGEYACLLLQVYARDRDALTLQDECTAIIKHALLSTEGEAWSRLDGTLKELNGLFKGLLISQSVTDIHAILTIVDRTGALHVSHAGRGEAWLLRGSAASQITEFSRGKPLPNFVHISSGQLESGDTVVFSTHRLMRAFTPAQLSQLQNAGDTLLADVATRLQAEGEIAALASLQVDIDASAIARTAELPLRRQPAARAARRGRRSSSGISAVLERAKDMAEVLWSRVESRIGRKNHVSQKQAPGPRVVSRSAGRGFSKIKNRLTQFLADLRDPERKRRAHLLLLASALAAFLLIWLVVHLTTNSQRSKTRAQLAAIIEQVATDLQTADNRALAGDTDAANAILQRAEDQTKAVIDNESHLYRSQAADLLAQIRTKREKINNITSITSPSAVADLSAKKSTISAQGLIGVTDGELMAFDRQDSLRILSNTVNEAVRVSDDELLLSGTYFQRTSAAVFMTTGNSIIEVSDGQVTTMKTEDLNGWVSGKDIETYGRFLYILSPETKQIMKYERLSNRYASPVNYNVNADVSDAIDMTIDNSVYILKQGGVILRLLRGETQPFAIRHAPANLLKNVTKIFKVAGSNLYLLDPTDNVVMVTSLPSDTGESAYVRQYVFEVNGMTKLQDLYIDPDENHLFVLDQKHVYTVDLKAPVAVPER